LSLNAFLPKPAFFSAIHEIAVEESRKLKPELPLVGQYGLPIQDEIEFELTFKYLLTVLTYYMVLNKKIKKSIRTSFTAKLCYT
jgi:hypothetical protein